MVAKAKTALAEILNLMGMNATVAEKAGVDSEEYILDVKAVTRFAPGARTTLDALQYLITRIAGERPGNEAPHIVSISRTTTGRRQTLQDMRCAWARRPTPAQDCHHPSPQRADRKVVHSACKTILVTTRSLAGRLSPLADHSRGDVKLSAGPAAAQSARATAARSTGLTRAGREDDGRSPRSKAEIKKDGRCYHRDTEIPQQDDRSDRCRNIVFACRRQRQPIGRGQQQYSRFRIK